MIEKAYRISVYVPPSHLEALLESITKVLPICDHKYSEGFWWSAPGTEQYKPCEGANPASGKVGEVSREDSIELKFLIPRDKEILNQIIQQGIRPAHPWEVPVITIDECEMTGEF